MPKIYTGTWLEAESVGKLDSIAQELKGTRAQALRYVVETALSGEKLVFRGGR